MPPDPTPLNPSNVPQWGDQTFNALAPVTAKQLRMIDHLKRLAGNSPTWVADCHLVLGKGWDGDVTHLSKAAATYLITVMQAGLVAVAEPDDDLQIEGHPA